MEKSILDEKLTAGQVSYLLDYSATKALRLICEAQGIDVSAVAYAVNPDTGKRERLSEKKLPMHMHVTVGEFEAKHNLGIDKCISSIRCGISKNKESVEYLCKKMEQKIKKSPKTHLYPTHIRIPDELRQIIQDESEYEKLITVIDDILGPKLKPSDKQPRITIR